ncbi:hypothetical protein EV363DRAFT_728479 [Boletus edulis]|uniref:Uncharacterized protein n=1 Tax=Boletus edulis BED1 TaxID=1328754 RepID=A0AAD4C4B9_BOLED|nr:hypothetical protein EV363DRAFT_728479 [Boletus edulis]KAF8448006.1 hypothetical protein L210DRAFT_958133 [Boletus edulis BED1]
MDRFLAPHTSEALAHSHLTENWFAWDQDHPSFNETLVAGCASYQAFNRYLSGSDLFIVPRSRSELESVLRRYAYDSIHNAIAVSRRPLQRGGYSRTCLLAEKSIRGVLNTNDNAEVLVALHTANRRTQPSTSDRALAATTIRT